MLHVICDTWCGVNILSKFQLPSSYSLCEMKLFLAPVETKDIPAVPVPDLMDYVGSVGHQESHHEGDTQVENLHTVSTGTTLSQLVKVCHNCYNSVTTVITRSQLLQLCHNW